MQEKKAEILHIQGKDHELVVDKVYKLFKPGRINDGGWVLVVSDVTHYDYTVMCMKFFIKASDEVTYVRYSRCIM